MENHQCPHCHNNFKGLNGLRVHLRKQGSCNSMQRNLLVGSSAGNVSGALRLLGRPSNANPPFHNEVEFLTEANPVNDSGIRGLTEDFTPDSDTEDFLRLLRQGVSLRQVNASSATSIEEEEEYYNENLEVAYAILTCRNGQGLSRSDTNRLLAAFTDTRFSMSRLKIKCYDDIEKFCSKLQRSIFGENVCKKKFFFF